MLSRGRDEVLIPGTKWRAYLEQNAGALAITLTEADRARLEDTFAPGVASGLRYPERQLKGLGI